MEKKKIDRIPYKPVTVIDLQMMLIKYKDLDSYSVAVKLLVNEELFILQKDIKANETINF